MTKSFRMAAVCSLLIPSITLSQQSRMSLLNDGRLSDDANNFPAFESGYTAEEVVAKKLHFDTIHGTYILAYHPNEEVSPHGSGVEDVKSELQGLTYNNDAVVIGRPTVRRSALTQDHHFIFSDYEFALSSVLSDPGGRLRDKHVIVVSRPGGEVTLGTNKIRAIDSAFPLFHLDEEYLLFLHQEASGSFSVTARNAFKVSDGLVKAAHTLPRKDNSELKLAAAVVVISNAAALNPRRSK